MKLWPIANVLMQQQIVSYFKSRNDLDDYKSIINYGGYKLFTLLYSKCNKKMKSRCINHISTLNMDGIYIYNIIESDYIDLCNCCAYEPLGLLWLQVSEARKNIIIRDLCESDKLNETGINELYEIGGTLLMAKLWFNSKLAKKTSIMNVLKYKNLSCIIFTS